MSAASPVGQAASRGLAYLGHRPLVLLTVALVFGIAWADWAAPPLLPLLVLLGLAVVAAVYAARRMLPAAHVFALLGMFLAGGALHAWRITPGSEERLPAGGVFAPRATASIQALTHQSDRVQIVVARDLALAGSGTLRRALLQLPAEPVLRLGQRVTLGDVSVWRPPSAGTPGETDSARELARDGVFARGRAKRLLQVASPPSASRSLDDALTAIHARMLATLTAAMPGPDPATHAELLLSMVYGTRVAPVSATFIELFRNSGTIHLLVVSGSQVSIIAFSLIFLVRGSRRVLPVWGMLLVAAVLVGLAVLTGLGASINRAVAMSVVLLGSFAWGRQYDFPTALAASALGLCLLHTGTVFDLGAQLTYACSLGVYLAIPLASDPALRPSKLKRFGFTVLWGTLGAWAFSAPLLMARFHTLVVVGGLANLIAVPLSVALLYLGLAAIGLSLIWAPLAIPLCGIARLLLTWLLQANTFFADLPLARLEQVYLPPWTLVAWYVVAGLIIWVLRSPTPTRLVRSANWRSVLPVSLALLGAGVFMFAVVHLPAQELRVDVLDVGAGQCVLVRAPGGHNLLVDAGTEPFGLTPERVARDRVLPFLALQGVRSLDAIILSHPHDDHCNLATGVLDAIPTRQLLLGPDLGAEQSWLEVLQWARNRGLTATPLAAGGMLAMGETCRMEVLEPTSLLSGTSDDSNNNSAVLRLVYGETEVLLPADLQVEGERRLLEDYATGPEVLHADVLIAPHHASVHSGSEAFLRAMNPATAIISCGRGARRPRPEALQVYEALGIAVWRTDLSGTIHVASDGRRVSVRGHRTTP